MENDRAVPQNAEQLRHNDNESTGGGKSGQSVRRYSHWQELINNLPYMVMTLLGGAVLAFGIPGLLLRYAAASVYVVYGVVGTLWIILFVCPYCGYWGTRACPCGYGWIAAKIRARQTDSCFTDKFKRHIPVIVPLWFIPVVIGIPLLVRNFSWGLLILLVVFALEAFVVLPFVSAKHGCKECPQVDTCPWMKGKHEGTSSYPSAETS